MGRSIDLQCLHFTCALLWATQNRTIGPNSQLANDLLSEAGYLTVMLRAFT